MTRLALVMIVRNEARCMARCLESVRPLVDRMIVLDTGSTDDTAAIAEGCGAIVHHYRWCDDFSAARNAALDQSNADWNLVLDADDWIDGGVEALGEDVLPPARISPPRFVGCVTILNHGRNGRSASRKFIPRILPRGVRYQGRVHEQPISALPQVLLPLRLRTDGYEDAQLANKAGRNEALLLAEIAGQPHDPYFRYQLGREYLVRGDAAQGADNLLAAYRLSSANTPYRHSIVVSALQALKRAGRLEEAIALADAEHLNWPASPDFYFAVADLYLDWAGRNPEIALSEMLPIVENAWKRCLAIGEQPGLDGAVEGCGSYLAAENLAMFYETLGLADEASHYSQASAEMRAQLG